MARLPGKQNITVKFVPAGMEPARAAKQGEGISHLLLIASISLVVFFLFSPSLHNLFTDWDDKGYVLTNPIIRDLSLHGLKDIFTTPVMGNYHPITILTYAIEYRLVQLDPWLYHLDSVLFHILTVAVVYWCSFLLTNNKYAAAVTSLLFGLTPMHAEPVAWVAGRKDILCALFYFTACISYVYYTRASGRARTIWYAGVLLLFICALLSKPVAVTLPVVLLLTDLYNGRPRSIGMIMEKTPHFILSALFGVLSVIIQHGGGAMQIHKVSYTIVERVSLAGYALTTYLWKSLLPIDLKCIYPYPEKTDGALSSSYLFYIFFVFAAILAAWKYARTNKAFVFGLLFFFVNITLLLQLVPVGDAIVSERYSYIPYFGLFFPAGVYLASVRQRSTLSYLMYMALAVLLLWWGYLSHERCKVWYDTRSLWTDEIKKEPARVPVAYNNLGFYFFEKRPMTPADHDSALYYLDKAVQLNPDLPNAHEGLGILYFTTGNYAAAETHFRSLIQLKPSSDAYYDLGAVLYALGKKDAAMTEYSKAIALNRANHNALLNRGIIYKEQLRWDSAMVDLSKVIGLSPLNGAAYYHRSFCDTQQQNSSMALQDIEKAISLGYRDVDSNYYNSLKER